MEINANLAKDDDECDAVLPEHVRGRLPVIARRPEAEQLVSAVIEALSDSAVLAEIRAGAVWQRKGYDTAGSVSPRVSPSPYRQENGRSEEVCLSITLRIRDPHSVPEVESLVAALREQAEAAQLKMVEAQLATRRNALAAEQSKLDDLEALATSLRAKGGVWPASS